MTKKKRYKRYSAEFKREALKRASEEGVTDVIVCEELGISARQLRRWRELKRKDQALSEGKHLLHSSFFHHFRIAHATALTARYSKLTKSIQATTTLTQWDLSLSFRFTLNRLNDWFERKRLLEPDKVRQFL